MSSEDNDPDTRQRTVAELIAQHKGGSGRSDVPRGGRRRRAEDGADDTAPQAIIDRVLADSGSMRAVDDSAPPHTTRAQRRAPPSKVSPRYASPHRGRASPRKASLRMAKRPPSPR
jgi:hypothetical protein